MPATTRRGERMSAKPWSRSGQPRRGRRVGLHLHVGVLVDEPNAVLEAPEAARAAARQVLHDRVARLRGLLLDVRQDRSNHLRVEVGQRRVAVGEHPDNDRRREVSGNLKSGERLRGLACSQLANPFPVCRQVSRASRRHWYRAPCCPPPAVRRSCKGCEVYGLTSAVRLALSKNPPTPPLTLPDT